MVNNPTYSNGRDALGNLFGIWVIQAKLIVGLSFLQWNYFICFYENKHR